VVGREELGNCGLARRRSAGFSSRHGSDIHRACETG
jgi:hypothetical protein